MYTLHSNIHSWSGNGQQNANNLKLLQFKCMTEKTSNKGTLTQSHPLKQIHTIALQVQQLKLLLGTSVSRLIPESHGVDYVPLSKSTSMWSSHSVPAGRVPPPVLKSECLNCSVHLSPIHHILPSFRFTSSKPIKELKMHQEFVVVFSLVCYIDTSAQLWQIWFYNLQKKSKRWQVRGKV